MTYREWRRTLIVALAILASAAVLVLVWLLLRQVWHAFGLVAAGLALAFVLGPFVDAVQRIVHFRSLAIVVVYLVVITVAGLGLSLLMVPLLSEIVALVNALPRYYDTILERAPVWQNMLNQYLDIPLPGAEAPINFNELGTNILSALQNSGRSIISNLVAVVTGASNLVANIVLAAVIGFYFLLDGDNLMQGVMNWIPPRYRPAALHVRRTATRVFGGYLRGQLLIAIVLGTAAGIGVALLGVPYSLLIGALAGIFELVPMVGAVLGAIPALVIAAFQPFPTVLYVLVFFVVLQQVEGNVLVPRVTGHSVGIHPLASLVALLAGLEVAGILGAIVAVPVTGFFYNLVKDWQDRVTAGESVEARLPELEEPDAAATREDQPSAPAGSTPFAAVFSAGWLRRLRDWLD